MQTLAAFIREHKPQILDQWVAAAAKMPSTDGMTVPEIRDHIPQLIDRLAEVVEHAAPAAPELKGTAHTHAMLRLDEGYDLREVIAEYRLLRRIIMDLYAERTSDLPPEAKPRMVPLALMHESLDWAFADAVDQFIRERDRSRERFLGILSHDLREPLHAVLMGTRLLQTQPALTHQEVAATVARIAASAGRMERMISDLLEFARSQMGGKLPLTPGELDAMDLVAQAVAETGQAHPERGITHVPAGADGNYRVTWDADRVAQALSNLIVNAIVHGQDPVHVTIHDGYDHLHIDVRNRGEIDPEVRPHLFDPFRSAGRGRGRGLGLGLSIVQEIARAHGGSIEGRSSGGTTTFRLTLPRHAGGGSSPTRHAPGGS